MSSLKTSSYDCIPLIQLLGLLAVASLACMLCSFKLEAAIYTCSSVSFCVGKSFLIVGPDLLDVLLLEPGGSNVSAFGEKIKLIT